MEVKRFLSVGEIKALARDAGQYNRALDCAEKLFQFEEKQEAEDNIKSIRLNSKCRGSNQDQPPYSVTAKINEQTGIVDSYGCDCVDFKKRAGRECCKHIIAILIRYRSTHVCENTQKATTNSYADDKSSTAFEPCERKCKKKLKSLSFEHEKLKSTGRCLPSWMAEKNKKECKRKKSKASVKSTSTTGFLNNSSNSSSMLRTVYCILPEELMQYAKDMLEKEETNNSTSVDERNVPLDVKTTPLKVKPSILDDFI